MDTREFDYDPDFDDYEMIQDTWLDNGDYESDYSVGRDSSDDEYDDVDHDQVLVSYGYPKGDSDIGVVSHLDNNYQAPVSADCNSEEEDEEKSGSSVIRYNLVTSIEQSLGVRVVTSVARFNLAGWYLQVEGPLPCGKCGENYRVFRCPYETSAGIYKYWALFCRGCQLILTLDDVLGAEQKILRKWGQESVQELSDRTKKIRKLERAAAEHIVMFELTRRGIMVTYPPIGVADVDLCVVDNDLNIVKNLKVNTFKISFNTGWLMRSHAKRPVSSRHFYIFVNFEKEVPICYVIPSEVISKATTNSRDIWIGASNLDIIVSSNLDIQNSSQSATAFKTHGLTDGWVEEYRGRWDLLGH